MTDREEETTIEQTATPAKIIRTTKKVMTPPLETEPPRERYESKKVIFRTYQVIWYILGVIETLLVFRIFLMALGANPASLFTNFIYTLSDLFVSPFMGTFQTTRDGTSVFEISAFVACFVYLILAYGIVLLFQFFKPTTPEEVEQNV